MKRLYIIAGGSDGYCSIQYTFDSDAAHAALADNPEEYSDDGCLDWINVPDDMTYECLGVSGSILEIDYE